MTEDQRIRFVLCDEIALRKSARDEAMKLRAPFSDIIRRDLEIARLLSRLEPN